MKQDQLIGNFNRYTLFKVKEPGEPWEKENLERKVTKVGVQSFKQAIAEHEDVTLEDVIAEDQKYAVQIQFIEQDLASLKQVMTMEETEDGGARP